MSRKKTRILGLVYGALALLIVCGVVSADADMNRVSVTGVADQMASSNYKMSVTSVPFAGSSGVCPSGAASALGFWSVKGPMKVPVRLMLDKNEINSEFVDLLWTGQASIFEIYRSTSPVELVSPGNLLRTSTLCDETDATAGSHDILFFKVMIPTVTE